MKKHLTSWIAAAAMAATLLFVGGAVGANAGSKNRSNQSQSASKGCDSPAFGCGYRRRESQWHGLG